MLVKKTLQEYGAVSGETAYEMAKGLMDKSNLDIVLSVTGIAGPDGGTPKKTSWPCLFLCND